MYIRQQVRTRHGFATLVLALLAMLPLRVSAQTYPSQIIRLVNPYAAGGPSDLIAREISGPMAEALGQQVIVENRPGGGSTIGANFVAKSQPDGYTIGLLGAPSLIIAPATQAKPLYDGVADFTPICNVTNTPSLVVVHPSVPAHSIAELIAYARANPGKLNVGSPGNGSLGHLLGELIMRKTGVKLVHVPYKGGAPAVIDLVAGNINMGILQVSAVRDHIKSGKLRAIATGGKQRSEVFPDLPSVYESGFTEFDASAWTGLYGPRGLPRSIVDRLHQVMLKVTAPPQLRARLLRMGVQVRVMGPDETSALMRDERDVLVDLIRSAGLKND